MEGIIAVYRDHDVPGGKGEMFAHVYFAALVEFKNGHRSIEYLDGEGEIARDAENFLRFIFPRPELP